MSTHSKFACPNCDLECRSSQGLQRHLNRKFKCNRKSKYDCQHCHQSFSHRQSRNFHQKSCNGPKPTIEGQQKRIENLETVISAIGKPATSGIQNNITNKNCVINNEQVNNIQNNINVFVAGQENIDYIKAMPFEELKKQIGSNPDPNIIMNFFKLRRINEEHPENHSLLLPAIDSESIHYKDADGWKETSYDEKMRGLLHEDNLDLQSRFSERQQESHYSLYWGYLVHDLMTKCTRMDYYGLKPILDGLREPLHTLTAKLASANKNVESESESEEIDEDLLNEQALDLQKQLLLVEQQQINAKLKRVKNKKKGKKTMS